MNALEKEMQKIAYILLCKHAPREVEAIKDDLRKGRTPRQIEKSLRTKKFETSLIANSAILAAYHIKEHPELLTHASHAPQCDEGESSK